MALLQRTRLLAQQRLDLPDFNNIEDFVCADFKAIHKNVWADENFVISGFEASGTGGTELAIALSGSSGIFGEDDGTLYIGAESLSDLTTEALTPSATNYVEISVDQDTGGADSRAFWDPTANAGEGGEFSQIIDTFIFLTPQLEINTSSFTGDANKLPICEVDVNGAGVITEIRDARNMFYRLGRRGDVNFTYSWASRSEPLDTEFGGADKDLARRKQWFDAVMSRILELAGGNYWYEDVGVSLVGAFRNASLSAISGIGSNAKWSWDGSNLSITDDNGTPADSDVVASIRLFDSTANLDLTRMDGQAGSSTIALGDGEVLWVELPDPLADTTYDDVGLTSTNYRVSARGSVPNDDTTFWLAYREGTNAYLRYLGELEPGETAEISDNINENILNIIGVAAETDDPNYSSTNVVTQNTDLVSAIGELDAAIGAALQDRNAKLIEGGTWSFNESATPIQFAESDTNSGLDASGTSNDLTFRGQSFTPTVSGNMNSATLSMRRTGSQSGNAILRLFADSGGTPGALISSSDPFDVSTLTGSFQDITFNFATPQALVSATLYHIVLDVSGVTFTSGTIFFEGTGTNPYAGGTFVSSTNGGSSYTSSGSVDADFSVLGEAADQGVTLSEDAYVTLPGISKDRNTISAQTISLPNTDSVAYVTLNRDAGAADVRPVTVDDINNLDPNDPDIFIFARRVSDGVVVGNASFLLKDGEYLELDGALAEINRLLGQLKIVAHEADTDKVRISAADIDQLDGTTLSQTIGDFILSFDGAVIDFTTGEVFESDGTTPLGNDFTPFTIPASEYFWYGLSLLPGNVAADNRQLATVQVDLAAASDSVQGDAPHSVISGEIKRGMVQVQNNGGSVEVVKIKRLGPGSGSGSGAGANPKDPYEDRLCDSIFDLVSSTAFELDKEDYLSGTETGAYSPADRAFKFSAIGETMVDTNNAIDTDWQASNQLLNEIELYLRWKEGSVDDSATYEVSRNGGNEWQEVTMERVGSTNAYRGFHQFDTEAANQTVDSNGPADGTVELDDAGNATADTPISVGSLPAEVRELTLTVDTVTGSPVGNLFVRLVRDDGGNPSTDIADIVAESGVLDISTLVAGNITFSINPSVLEPSATYHWVVLTNQAYKNNYSGGTNAISLDTVSGDLLHTTEGIELDLRVRVTAGTADTLLESYGIYYDTSAGITTNASDVPPDLFVFSGDDDRTEFILTNIQNPDPHLLVAYDKTRGQSYVWSPNEGTSFKINGQTITFADGTFDDPGETIELEFRQIPGGNFDSSNTNANDIAANAQDISDINTRLEDALGTMVFLSDKKTANTEGGTFTSGAWQPRIINTLVGPGTFCSLTNGTTGTDGTANQFTLTAGTYKISAKVPAREVAGHKAKLQNITDGAVAIIGTNGYTNSGEGHDYSFVIGTITIDSTKTFQIQHWGNTTKASNGFGLANNIDSTDETYTFVEIIKIGV